MGLPRRFDRRVTHPLEQIVGGFDRRHLIECGVNTLLAAQRAKVLMTQPLTSGKSASKATVLFTGLSN